MKKILVMIFVSILIISACLLSACGDKQQSNPESAESETETAAADGGWTVSDISETELPDEVKTAFEIACETLTGSYKEVIPVAYIGRQVVAGNNYAILCRVTYADENAPAALMVLTVYADLEGNAEIFSSEEFSIADYNVDDEETEEPTEKEPLTGGWQTPEEITVTPIPEDAQAAFDKAVESFTGNDLTPMALLGTQVVAGTNYAFLCHSSLVTEEPSDSIQVVIVYEDLEGNATISSIKTVDTGLYVNY